MLQVPPRVDVVHVVPYTNAFGIVPLNDTETGLAEAVVCSLCSPPNMRRRKFLYFTTTFEDAWADVATAEFRAKKLELETAVDALFLEKMTAADTKIPLEKGYEGALVISLFRSTPDQLGAGLQEECCYMLHGIS